MNIGINRFASVATALIVGLSMLGCGGGSSNGGGTPPPSTFGLSVTLAGSGSGTISSSPSGISCGSTCSASYNTGTVVQLTAAPTGSSIFAGWSGACSGTGTCQVTMSAAQSVTATFNVATNGFQLNVSRLGVGTGSVTSSPAGINCGLTCSAIFNTGTVVQLTATPVAGSIFAGWGGACSGTGSCQVTLNSTQSVTASFAMATSFQLDVSLSGTGTGTVTSSPSGINCGATCSATYNTGTVVTLTAAASNGSTFAGWSGSVCSGTGTCQVTMSASQSVIASFNVTGGPTLQSSINHIIIMVQENRSFDHYFGSLRQYWADNGYSDQPFDGLPQFPLSNPAGPAPTNPGCDPAFPVPADCTIDSGSPLVTSYPLSTICLENPSPTWNEAHTAFNRANPTSGTALLDGFVRAAGHDSRAEGFFDTDGIRVMGYYDDTQLPYYYYMATQFGTSDRWFSPVMTRTTPNRLYLLSGTSHGHAYPLNGSPLLTEPLIFTRLQNAGISWKIYIHPPPSGATDPQTLYKQSYIQNFTYGKTILSTYPQNLVPIAQYFTDLQNGTLPAFAFIEPASSVALDEHASDSDVDPTVAPNIKAGAAYVSTLINGLMGSSSWKDSIFILTYDEYGGFYDHVAPIPAVSPDNIAPSDLLPGDTCTVKTGPTCDFTYTGYRVPLIVMSPFAKKHYVSHTPADYTAMLKLVETRFGLANLTARDAAQMDMTEFFDFANPPWMTPPTPPTQGNSGPCYLDHLP